MLPVGHCRALWRLVRRIAARRIVCTTGADREAAYRELLLSIVAHLELVFGRRHRWRHVRSATLAAQIGTMAHRDQCGSSLKPSDRPIEISSYLNDAKDPRCASYRVIAMVRRSETGGGQARARESRAAVEVK